jgi:toxin ParE1/3/4
VSSCSGRRYRLPPQAIEDLIQIYNFLYERSPLAGKRFTNDSERKIIDLAGSRNPGVCRERLKPGLGAFPYRRRCIYFRVVKDALVVLRITHGRQDITPRHLS